MNQIVYIYSYFGSFLLFILLKHFSFDNKFVVKRQLIPGNSYLNKDLYICTREQSILMHHCQINNLCIIWVYVRYCCSFNFKTDIDISVSFRFSMTVSGLSYKDFLKKFNHCSNVKYYHYCCKENINVIFFNHPPKCFQFMWQFRTL